MANFKENGKLKLLIIVGTRPEIIRLAAFTEQCGREARTALSGGETYRLLAHWHDAPKAETEERAYMWQSNAAYTKPE